MSTDDSRGDQPPPAIPLEAVAGYPLPGLAAPSDLAFSPDDRLITYLWSAEGTLVKQLYAFDPATGEQQVLAAPDGGTTEQKVSPEEALRRERQRQRALGIAQYAWAERAERVLIPLQGGIAVQDGLGAPLRHLLAGGDAPALDPQFSPDGTLLAFVRDAELYVLAVQGGAPRQVTFGARGTGKIHGLAEYIAQEEMHRHHGFWWSPDGKLLALTEVDETPIPVYRILHQGQEATGPAAQEDHRYPFAGAANAKVRLGVVSIEGGEPAWLDLGAEERYLARVDWGPDGALYAQLENREQTALELLRFDPAGGPGRTLLHERSDLWINLHDMFRPLKTGGFLWASERSGFQHLYRYDAAGELLRQLTSGEWLVESIVDVDEERGIIYVLGTLDGPTERQLYALSLEGGPPRRLTSEPGMHAVTADHGHRRFLDVCQALDRPPLVTLRALDDGALLCVVYDRPDSCLAALALVPPHLLTLPSRDGVTLYGALYRPPAAFGAGPYPAIIAVYGGPHSQQVANAWTLTANMRAQSLRRQGYLVFMLDNRGSARRGLAFEGAIKRRLGGVEVDDQVDGVRWLVAQGLADPQRVGIYGWSYGGYMAALCLARAPETFAAAVAGAPVTHWDGYDTHYTERYMGTPQANPAGYAAGSVMAHVGTLRGKLLLVHGLIDENVHFRHTARLINTLIAAGKPYELLLFPDERHMPRQLADRVYMEARIAAFFAENLSPGRPSEPYGLTQPELVQPH